MHLGQVCTAVISLVFTRLVLGVRVATSSFAQHEGTYDFQKSEIFVFLLAISTQVHFYRRMNAQRSRADRCSRSPVPLHHSLVRVETEVLKSRASARHRHLLDQLGSSPSSNLHKKIRFSHLTTQEIYRS
jgi:hypothetical protein